MARALFEAGSAFARSRGLLLVDTKYEFGLREDAVVLIDEIHTADSSRYWRADGYEAALAAKRAPPMLDKERLRRWLLGQGFSGQSAPPPLPDEVRADLALHYWELTETLTGQPFAPSSAPATERVPERLRQALA